MDKENLSKDIFGDPKRIKEYKMIFYSGIGVSIVGLFLFTFFKNHLFIYGIVFLLIGSMCIIAGFLGLREEYKKYGMERVETRWGKFSLLKGIIGLFLIHSPSISLIFAIAAIVLGIKAIREGDNTYGKDGLGCGIIILFIIFYLWVLDIFFIT